MQVEKQSSTQSSTWHSHPETDIVEDENNDDNDAHSINWNLKAVATPR